MSKFITNQEELLSEVINKILPTTENVFILVGYFYFSGFGEIYKNLQDKKLKIIVGLEVEKTLGNKIREFSIVQDINRKISISNKQIKDNFFNTLSKIINDTDFFDTKEKIEAFKIFIEKIHDGTLEIRKTKEPNHAKMYLFENKPEHSQGGLYPGTLITGSSNLTSAGLSNRFEINLIFRDEHYSEAKRLFDKLWESSVSIVNKENAADFLSNVVEKTWLEKTPRPFLLFLRVLLEYFATRETAIATPSEITQGRYLSIKYQVDAIKSGLSIIEKHSGILIADVVGLGKSIIASAIAHNLGLRTIIICPPHLKQQWRDYSLEFHFTCEVISSGKIEDALAINKKYDMEKLIIIDEAHKYRNEETIDYRNLHELCQKNKVILLTATPFNNRPHDIFSLVKLFQIPLKSTLQTVDNLSFQFYNLIKEYKRIKKEQKEKKLTGEALKIQIDKLAKDIRNLVAPLYIRRSRLDLEAIEEYKKDLADQNIDFPEVKEPEEIDYKLGDLSDLYIETLEEIAPEDEEKGFQGARYKPLHYVKEKAKKKIAAEFSDENLFEQSQINLALFMRWMLVRRFESSMDAFRKSLDNMIASSKYIVDWYEKLGRVPIYKKGNLPDVDTLFERTDDTDEELFEITLDDQLKKYLDRGLILIDKKQINDSFLADIKKDITLLEKVKQKWDVSRVTHDPKLNKFIRELNVRLKEEPERKLVVFTEFADTANYIYENIKDKFKVFKYTSQDASDSNKNAIINNFDASVETAKRENKYDILIATDAISEGFNLNRAGAIFNYDIPYNPTRVIQRVGRINRVNIKVFDKLYIYNFFPTVIGESETRTKQISTFKIALIHALIGEDTKVLTKDEELRSFFVEQYSKEQKSAEELSWDARFRHLYYLYKQHYPEFIEEALKLPHRSRVRRTEKKDKNGILVFARKGDDYIFKLGSNNESIQVPPEDAIPLFEADPQEKGEAVSVSFEAVYQNVKSNLFKKVSEVPLDRGKQKTIEKVEILKNTVIEKKDYLEDLFRVIKEFDGLSDYDMKRIREIPLNDSLKVVETLEKEISHEYIANIIHKAAKVEEGEEYLILSEELI